MVPWGHGDCSLWWGVFAWVLRVKICGLEHKQDSGTFQRCYQNVLTSAFVAFTVEFPTECGHLFLGLISNGVKVVKGFIWHSEVKNQRKIWNVSTFFSVAYNLVKTRLLESEAEERERVNQTQFSFPHFVNELVPSFHLICHRVTLSGIGTSFPRDCDVLCFWWQIVLCCVSQVKARLKKIVMDTSVFFSSAFLDPLRQYITSSLVECSISYQTCDSHNTYITCRFKNTLYRWLGQNPHPCWVRLTSLMGSGDSLLIIFWYHVIKEALHAMFINT